MASYVARELKFLYGDLAVGSVASGTGVYTLEAAAPAWLIVGAWVGITGSTNSANNGEFEVTGITGSGVTTSNSASVAEASSPGVMAFACGGNSDFMPTDKMKISRDYEKLTATFDVVFSSTTESGFVNMTKALEKAFKTPRQRFRIVQGTNTIIDLDPTAAAGKNTGFNQVTRADKAGSVEDSGRSRRYAITVESQTPADLDAQNGLLSASIALSYEPNRRKTITISGRYTALSANDSRAQYNASISAYATAVTAAIGGTYELTGEQATVDVTDKNCDFSRTYREVIFSELSGTLNDPAIVQQSMSVSRDESSGDDSPLAVLGFAKPLINVTATYDAWIDKDVTTDLRAKWETIKTWVITTMTNTLSGGTLAIIKIAPTFHYADNRISATIQGMGATGVKTLSYSISRKFSNDPGVILTPAWAESEFARYRHPGPATRTFTLTITETRLGYLDPFSVAPDGNDFGAALEGVLPPPEGNWERRPTDVTYANRSIGLAEYSRIDVTDIQRNAVWEYYKEVPGAKPNIVSPGGGANPPGPIPG